MTRWLVLLGALVLTSGCGGRLLVSEGDVLGFDDDHVGGDDLGGGGDNHGPGDDDGPDGDAGGDGFGDFDFGDLDGGDLDCSCGGACCNPTTQECVNDICMPKCPTERCGEAAICCSVDNPVCINERFCHPAPPDDGDTYEPCGVGTGGAGWCNVSDGLECGPSEVCVTACTATETLCGDDASTSNPGVCCGASQVCSFGACITPGAVCDEFQDCEAGEYCDPLLAKCLPNTFPPGTPECRQTPDDLFSPRTEWAWVGVQLVGTFTSGQVLGPCADATSTNCYREPCTNFFSGSACYRHVESIPTVSDLDQVTESDGKKYPEVVFKAYASSTFDGVHLLVVLDGRTGKSKKIIYGETRGHVALGNLDDDVELEIVAARNPGLRAYDPFPSSVGDNVIAWSNASGALNNAFNAGAPELTDLNNDGAAEVVMGSVIVDGETGTTLLDLGTADMGGTSQNHTCAGSGDCFAIGAVADVNLDGKPELLVGHKAFTITETGGSWSSSLLWTASSPTGAADSDLGRGYPGVANFVDNTKPPYNEATDYPEVAVVYNGFAYILHGGDGRVMRSPVDGVTPLKFKLLNNRGGPPNIADFDGDGHVEVSFAGTGCMVVVDPDCAVATAEEREDLALDPDSGCTVDPATVSACTVQVSASLGEMRGVLWMSQTEDESSAVTGTSVFDFQGDGKAEVLYNDECFFRVFEGATGDILFELPNSHRTATEYPIVVDADGDSNSEILFVSTGDQSSDRDRCNGPAEASPTCSSSTTAGTCDDNLGACLWDANTCKSCADLNQSQCGTVDCCSWNASAGACEFHCENCGSDATCEDNSLHTGGVPTCRWKLGQCLSAAYRRDQTLYEASACGCQNFTDAEACDAARGCSFSGGTCNVSVCTGLGKSTCEASDDCLWDPYESAGAGACEDHPRGQGPTCTSGTWGVMALGDTRDRWVRTLPYWHQHAYHVTEIDRAGQPLADWAPNDDNWDVHNNWRQNVQGFVPLNAPDLKVVSLTASLLDCPPTITLTARVVNQGRAGIVESAKVCFYLANDVGAPMGSPLSDASSGEVSCTGDELPYGLLPGQGANVRLVYEIPSFVENLSDFDFYVVVNPDAEAASEDSDYFECNPDDNEAILLDLSCETQG